MCKNAYILFFQILHFNLKIDFYISSRVFVAKLNYLSINRETTRNPSSASSDPLTVLSNSEYSSRVKITLR